MTNEGLIHLIEVGTAVSATLGLILIATLIIEIFKGGYGRYVDMDSQESQEREGDWKE